MTNNDKSTKLVKGTVVSNKMKNTIIVRQDRKIAHKLYKKYITRSVKFVAHDENNVAKIGDVVTIEQTRPLSKTKRWKLVDVIAKEQVI